MTINVPETLEEITLAQYQEFDKANKEDADGEFLIHRMVNIFCGITLKNTLKIPLEQAEEIANDIADVLSQEGTFKQTFEFEGTTYGMIPDLTKITLGEYVDLEGILKKDTQTLHKAMGVLYRPITKRFKKIYDIEEYESATKYSERFKKASSNNRYKFAGFFYNLSNELLKAFPASLLNETLKKEQKKSSTTQQKDSLQQNTDGSLQYINWLTETLPSLIK